MRITAVGPAAAAAQPGAPVASQSHARPPAELFRRYGGFIIQPQPSRHQPVSGHRPLARPAVPVAVAMQQPVNRTAQPGGQRTGAASKPAAVQPPAAKSSLAGQKPPPPTPQLGPPVPVMPSGPVDVVPLDELGILLLRGAPEDVADMAKIIDKILEISQQVEPTIRVFQLYRASASQVRDTILELYGGTPVGGTGTAGTAARRTTTSSQQGLTASPLRQFQIAANDRSNTLVIMASPAMMEELGRLIQRLDVDAAPVVNEIRVFKLTSAEAQEVSELLNQAIAQAAAGQQAGAGAAAGQEATLARRFAVLRFVPVDGKDAHAVDSGILDEIRVTPQIRTNSVVVSAPSSSMDLMAAIIKELDRPPSLVADIRVFTLQNSDATNMRLTLSELFDIETATGTIGGVGVTAGIAGQTQFQRPVAVAEGPTPPVAIRVAVDARTNSLIVSGASNALDVVEAVIWKLDSNDLQARQNTTYRLKHANASDVADAVTQFFSQKRQIEAQARTLQQQDLIGAFQRLEQEVVVVPEQTTNTLLISASPRYFKDVMKLIEDLDRMQDQVLIQVLVAELDLTGQFEFGLELGLQDSFLFNRSGIDDSVSPPLLRPGFNFNSTDALGNSPIPGSTTGLPSDITAGAGNVAGQVLSNFALGRAGSAGFGGLILAASSESVSILLRALQERGCLKIISRPQIVTLDGRAASVRVIDRIPYLAGATSTQTSTTTETSFVEVGVILEVTPIINEEGKVVMQIAPEVSELTELLTVSFVRFADGSTQPITAPRTASTIADTVVSVNDGQTVILGGLIQEKTKQTVRKIPWLGDLPHLGFLFRYTQNEQQRKELIFILTPHVIRSQKDMQRVKAEEIARVNWILEEAPSIHGDLGLDGELPQAQPQLNYQGPGSYRSPSYRQNPATSGPDLRPPHSQPTLVPAGQTRTATPAPTTTPQTADNDQEAKVLLPVSAATSKTR